MHVLHFQKKINMIVLLELGPEIINMYLKPKDPTNLSPVITWNNWPPTWNYLNHIDLNYPYTMDPCIQIDLDLTDPRHKLVWQGKWPELDSNSTWDDMRHASVWSWTPQNPTWLKPEWPKTLHQSKWNLSIPSDDWATWHQKMIKIRMTRIQTPPVKWSPLESGTTWTSQNWSIWLLWWRQFYLSILESYSATEIT